MVKPETVPGRRCGNCYHFERFPDNHQSPGDDILGTCMLHPPKVHGYTDPEEDGGAAPIQSRPWVYFQERCGQHQAQVN